MRSYRVWPLYVRPLHDELLSSWLIRIAHSHQQKIYTFYRSELKENPRIWNIDIDNTIRPEVLKLIAERCNTTIKKVIDCTLLSYEGTLFLKRNSSGINKWILPLGIYHTKRKKAGLMYCASCLAKDDTPYYRKKWRLSISLVCVTCGVWLKDRCGNCGQVVCFIRNDIGRKNIVPNKSISICFNCSFDLKNSVVQVAEPYWIQKQKTLYKYIDEGCTENLNYSHLYFDVLNQVIKVIDSEQERILSLKIALAKDAEIKTAYIKNYSSETFGYKGVSDRANILKMVFLLLEDWPINFISYCNKAKMRSSSLFKDVNDQETIPYWYYSIVKENFFIKTVFS